MTKWSRTEWFWTECQSQKVPIKEEITNFLWDECLDFSVDEYLDYEKPYLDSKQLLELKSFGNEIGSHSKSHPDFSNLSYFEFGSRS